jgi:beta-galactosidase
LEVVDENNQLIPDAVLPVSLSVSGAGELAAEPANPEDVGIGIVRQNGLKSYHGRALAIVRPKGGVGLATMCAEADGLDVAMAVVRIT